MTHFQVRTLHKTVTVLLTSLFLFQFTSVAQSEKSPGDFKKVDTEPFADATHHWYDIADKDMIVHPVSNQPRYKPTELENIGDNILLYQKNNGGWPKNYDMLAILTTEQKDSLLSSKKTLNTTFDNGTTYTQVTALAKIFTVSGQEKYREGALKGLDFILAAQYANGGWPQYFPLENNYSRYITFNDGAFEGIMQLLKDVIDRKPQYGFVDKNRLQKLQAAFNKGLDCIVKTQIKDNGKLTAWCQQYDEVHLQPAWARKFEPPSICNGESSNLVLFLMSLHQPSPAIINAVQNAVAWFEESKILNTRVKVIPAPRTQFPFRVSSTDRVVVNDPSARPIWTRYYELETHRPLFCNRDSKVVYSLAEVDRERRDGYSWYTYAPQSVLDKYPKWQKKWAPAYNVLKHS
ncbi:MAG: pectate lyase [Candidatus Dadabacteria bacterium]